MSIFSDIANKLSKSLDRGSNDSLGEMTDISEQSPDEKKLVEYVKNKIDMVRQTNSRITQEGVYLTNVAYLLGFDGVFYDTTYRQFKSTDPKRRLSRNRFKINKILPTIQNRLARLVQNSPKYDVRPNSNTSQDKDCARLGIEIITTIFEKQDFKEKQQDLLMSAMQGGVSYLQVNWDPMLGEPMVDPGTQEMVGYQGDVRMEVLNCLEVFPDPLAKNLDDAQWIIKAKVRKLDYFKDRYPERGQAVKEEGVWLLSSLYDMKANALSSVGIVGASTQEQMRNSAIELVYYEKRSKEHPNGRMIISASGILLEDKELPIGEFDIIKFDDILVGGRYNSEGVITHLRPVQDQYNITRTKCAEWVRKTLGGKFIVAKGAGLEQEALNNDSGEVIQFNPVPGAPPPQAMQIPAIPQYVYEEIHELAREFDFVSGINEASRGVAPGASMPFRGMALLVEQDQTRVSVQTTRNESGYAKVGCAILKYVGRYYEMPRLMKTAGDGLSYAVKEFKGADLNSNYDVIVMPGSTLPDSKALKRQDIMNMFMAGLLGNPQDPKLKAKVLKIMEYGDVAEMWKSQALDDQQIKKTIDEIENGTKPMVHEWDNHIAFIRELNDYRKSDKFDELSTFQKGLLNLCVEEHIQAEANIQNPQLQQQQLMAEHTMNTMNKMKAEGHPALQPGGNDPPGMPPAGQMPDPQVGA